MTNTALTGQGLDDEICGLAVKGEIPVTAALSAPKPRKRGWHLNISREDSGEVVDPESRSSPIDRWTNEILPEHIRITGAVAQPAP